MNTSTLQYILDRYDPENHYAPISNADAALLEMVIDLAERVQELEAMLKPAPALVQPTMFPDGEDTPLFTLPAEPEPEPQIEFTFRSMSPHNLDIANDCIDYAWPKNTVAGCWAHLDKLLARGTIPQAQYDEIKAGGDFIIVD